MAGDSNARSTREKPGTGRFPVPFERYLTDNISPCDHSFVASATLPVSLPASHLPIDPIEKFP
jgi:hypothetical protein